MDRAKNGMRLAVCTIVCLAVSGCADNSKDVADLCAFLQKPRTAVAGVPYIVLPPDVISISSQHVPELDKQAQQIRPDGKINLPLIGEVYVAAKTPHEIELQLIELARKYYRDDPSMEGHLDVTVQVAAYNSQKIYVFGQVGGPGPQPYTGCDTILDILAKVQPTYLAWPEHIKIIRAKQPRGGYVPYNKKFAGITITTQPESATQPADDGMVVAEEVMAKDLEIDMMEMIKKGDMSRNVLLYPNDVVYVPYNPFGEVGMALSLILYPFGPVLTTAQIPATLNGTYNNIKNPTGK